MDLADRKVIGWALSDNMEANTTNAWQMAIRNRPFTASLIFHSDREYSTPARDFREQFKVMPVLQSMSRKGKCWDNAISESFFKTMKTEMVYHIEFQTRAQAKLAIF